ncbi:MAG: NYN domain-containing protein [Deltaproteobacteria bacterium]|jgi:uncharacterized LabA/DUF88 family protein|nr:NYN domain-containing protein [Deltaproteobacteria bacterium]
MARDDQPRNPDLLAILIDADNAQPQIIATLLQEVAILGETVVKRIYGDFSDQKNSGWKKYIQNLAIKPVQQFSFTKGKNATDTSLIIDAMDLLYSRVVNGFCLVSSDSDFTGLAIRLRESGMKVYGFGEEKTPGAFRRACNKFVLTESLRNKSEREEENRLTTFSLETVKQKSSPPKPQKLPPKPQKAPPKPPKAPPKPNILPLELFLKAAEKTSRENGWMKLSEFASYVNQIQPGFDSRKYGHKKLSTLIKTESSLFKVKATKSGRVEWFSLTFAAEQISLPPNPNNLPLRLFRQAAEKTSRADGWMMVCEFGTYIHQIQPGFNSRKYGYKKLSDLINAESSLFSLEKRQNGDSKTERLYIRVKAEDSPNP